MVPGPLIEIRARYHILEQGGAPGWKYRLRKYRQSLWDENTDARNSCVKYRNKDPRSNLT